MSDRYTHVMKFMDGQVWAIVPEKLAVIRELMRLKASGAQFTDAQIKERLGLSIDEEPPKPRAKTVGNIAVLPLYGFLCPKANMVTEFSGGTSLAQYAQMFRAAMADQSVTGIVMDIDSGGGSVYGVEELYAEIMNARKVKRVVASVNHMAGSAAYWLACAADEIVVSPSGEVGSVGVYVMHEDLSGALEKEGVKVEFITAGEHKVEGNPYEPLSEDARAYLQSQIDACYGTFLRAVAKGRGVSTAAVEKNYGQGRMVLAREAVARGMADRVATLEEVVSKLAGKKSAPAGARASVDDTGFAIPPDVAEGFRETLLQVAAEDAAAAAELTAEINAAEAEPADDGAAERERLRLQIQILELE